LMMSVNLSAGRLVEPTLAEQIAAQVHDCGFDPGSLILEITESAILTDNDTTVRNLSALRALGVRIALDDFGTGYSTFSHLDRLQIDIVKIDKSFVETLDDRDGDSSAFVRAIVELAKSLGLITVAVGVQSEQQRAVLSALGCDLAQGYLMAPPLDTTEASNLIAGRSGAFVEAVVPLGERRVS
jgi:EAL domain-containing protein (putative c-di-GMP-specific phosphodiesterase class I)